MRQYKDVVDGAIVEWREKHLGDDWARMADLAVALIDPIAEDSLMDLIIERLHEDDLKTASAQTDAIADAPNDVHVGIDVWVRATITDFDPDDDHRPYRVEITGDTTMTGVAWVGVNQLCSAARP